MLPWYFFILCQLMFSLKLFSAMIQQPRVPSSGLMPASDVLIRAKEVDVLIYSVANVLKCISDSQ